MTTRPTYGSTSGRTIRGRPDKYRNRPRRLETAPRALYAAAGKTQIDVSKESGIAQGEVSKIEKRTDLGPVSLDVLRRYVAALGGELELVAAFPKHRFLVTRGSPEIREDKRRAPRRPSRASGASLPREL
jgi:transcriptional regulator with XRE-family HTH domain